MSNTITPVSRDDTRIAIDTVLLERRHQLDKWGEQRHGWPEWLSILTEEVGELAERCNELRWHLPDTSADRRSVYGDAYDEASHVAAVAVSIMEHLLEEITDEEASR